MAIESPLQYSKQVWSVSFDSFLHEFNEERPHEALDMKRPADLYPALTSLRRFAGTSLSLPRP
jgi:transposase InsO family protein